MNRIKQRKGKDRNVMNGQKKSSNDPDLGINTTTLMSRQMDRFLPSVIVSWLIATVSFVYFPVFDGQICNLKLDGDFNVDGRIVDKYVSVAIAGAACCSLIAQIVRHYTNIDHVADNGSAISIVAFLTTSVMASQQLVNALVSPRLCTDAFGLITPLSQWIEWMVSVPLMMYLNVTLDPYKGVLESEDLLILLFTESSIFVSFLSTTNQNVNFAITCVMFGTMFMFTALYLLARSSVRTYQRALRECQAHEKEFVHSDVLSINLKISTRKLLAAIYLCVALPLFPVVFFAGWFDWLRKLDVMSIIMIMNFLCKHVFALVLTEFRLDMMDPNKLALAAERVADSARRSFLRYVFHEVRVPLNSITMGLQLLRANPLSSPDSMETIEMMNEATHFMSETLNDVLSIQKIEEGKLDLDYHICDVDTILRNAYTSLRAHIASKGPTVSFIKGKNVPKSVIGDRFRLEHVLANIISNALRFSPRDGKITVVVDSLPVDIEENKALIERIRGGDDSLITDYAVLSWSVFDEGKGVKKSEQSKLFDPYAQLHASNTKVSRKSSGVSLSICKEIISKHNGIIGVRSDPEVRKGSEFYVKVPVKVANFQDVKISSDFSSTSARLENQKVVTTSTIDADANPAEPAVKPRDVAAGQCRGATGAKHVLVVDDVSSNRKLLLMLLKKTGELILESAACGEEAIEKYQLASTGFDIIFMDNMMPDMSGLEASAMLRDMGYQNLLIGVTGNASDADLEEFEQAGADFAIAKPIKSDALALILGHCERFGCASPSCADQDTSFADKSRESLLTLSRHSKPIS